MDTWSLTTFGTTYHGLTAANEPINGSTHRILARLPEVWSHTRRTNSARKRGRFDDVAEFEDEPNFDAVVDTLDDASDEDLIRIVHHLDAERDVENGGR